MEPTITKTDERDEKDRDLFDFHFDGASLYEPITIRSFDPAYATSLWVDQRIKLPDKVVEIRCSVCGKVGGSVSFPANEDIDTSKHAIEHGLIEDHRCEEHPA